MINLYSTFASQTNHERLFRDTQGDEHTRGTLNVDFRLNGRVLIMSWTGPT